MRLSLSSLLIKEIRELYKSADPGHDWEHIERMYDNTQKICERIPYISNEKLVLLTICHGLHFEEYQEKLKNLFQKNPPELSSWLITAINRHTTNPENIEEKIVHDANLLERTGAIGIARNYLLAGHFGDSINQNLDDWLTKQIKGLVFKTKAGGEIAKERNKLYEDFIKQLYLELNENEEV